MQLSPHDRKRLKRLTRDLFHWRRKLIKSIEHVNSHRYSEDRAKEMQAEGHRDAEIIEHIDILLLVMAEINDMKYEPEEVPEVKAEVHKEVKVHES